MPCTSRASSAATTRLACMRSPTAMRWWWTAPVDSSEGTGARSADTAASSISRRQVPLLTAASASVRRRSTAARKPAGPAATGKVASSRSDLNGALVSSPSSSKVDG